MIYYIDGYHLTLKQISEIAADQQAEVKLSEEAACACRKSRAQIDRWMQKDAPAIYGVNTGLGNLKDVVVPPEMHIKWNKKLPYPHAAGFGAYLPAQTTRMALLLRANILARAYSAVRVELIERLLSIFNAGIGPAVHSEGSTGLSDLAPMSQCVMTVAGLEDAKAYYQGELMPSRVALRKAGLPETFDLACKEVLAQMNGSTMTQAIAVISWLEFDTLYPVYLSKMKGKVSQDKQSAYQKTIEFAQKILNQENNITCDNPLLFELEDGNFAPVMGCNCSNTQVGYVLDLMSIILCEMAEDLMSAYPDENSNAPFWLGKLKTSTMQVSADSIPTKAGQEDHVEFSYTAARKFSYGTKIFGKFLVQ